MPLLSLRRICKEFPGVKALDDVSFDLDTGMVHALVGENGAGKSTLIKVLGGIYPAGTYSGDILLDNTTVRFSGVRDSEHAGIRIIHQELLLAPNLTVAENIFLGSEPMANGIINYTAMHSQARAVLDRLGCSFSVESPVEDLTVGNRQFVEIAKALSGKARILVFDEPTAALPEKDANRLLALIKDLAGQGIGVIYISHKLNEVLRIADQVTVLRNGRTVASNARAQCTAAILVKDMLGRSLESAFPALAHSKAGELLSIEKLTLYRAGHTSKPVVSDISFTVNKGEVVGIAGLLGSGRTALVSHLFGVFNGTAQGKVCFKGKEYQPSSPSRAIREGIAMVSEDRKQYGLLTGADICENLCIASLRRFMQNMILSWPSMTSAAQQWTNRLGVKTPSIDFIIDNLSGGNQQKVVLGRFLMTEPALLLLDDPTRGIDVGAKYEFYSIIHKLAEQGLGIIFISSELPEVLGISHRIYVFHEGEIRGKFNHGEKSEEEVLALAAGVSGKV